MSLGYAEKLSYRDDLGGQLGAPEIFDDPEKVAANAQQLADLVICCTSINLKCAGRLWECNSFLYDHLQIQASKTVIVFTGAGISTACGIPDFRSGNSCPRSSASVLEAPSCSLRRSLHICVHACVPWHQSAMMSLCRGPNGVWTMQRAGKPLPTARCSFTTATPSLTHMVST
jgi:mono-ADP-ribosyltransferase sirtuin 6